MILCVLEKPGIEPAKCMRPIGIALIHYIMAASICFKRVKETFPLGVSFKHPKHMLL